MTTSTEEFLGTEGMAMINTDFNLDNEYKEEPLIPPAVYFGNTTKVWFNGEKSCVSWQITLDGNEGVLSDGETPVDGATVVFNNWLPKPGDEDKINASGRATVRQSKINMLKRFADKMGIDMDTPQTIMENLTNQEWVGITVQVTIGTREYLGVVSNEVKDMKVVA